MTLTPDIFRMDGRIALVTGAGSGLGQSIALGLATFGAHVICADRYEDRIAETKAMQVNQYARESQHPLLCEIEKDG